MQVLWNEIEKGVKSMEFGYVRGLVIMYMKLRKVEK
jgi:hypothetical protein